MPKNVTARLIGGVSAAAFLGTLGMVPAASDPAAEPTTTAASAATPDDAVVVRPDPSYQGQEFEGWGTSLVWFANATGGYPDEIRNKLADMVFGPEGLNLNIARYNIGGGNAPDVPDYLRAGGAVEGWWQAPEGTTREDTEWWDPDNPEHWNLDADQTQRWWVDRIKDDVTHWEAFSNSPPWFQTESGYVSGNFDASEDQIRADKVDEFAAYVTGVVAELERAHGISVDTIDPLNEPNTPYWGTQLGADGNPTGGRQEGAHAGPELQQQVIAALHAALQDAETGAVISAMDETNPGTFATNWNAYSGDVRAMVDQLNVHTYGTGQRTTPRDIAKGEDKPLWMSEVGGSYLNGQNFESMVPGLGLAQHVVDDLRELEPSAWVFWQTVEDYNNMAPGGEGSEGANWGEIQLPFDCTAEDTLETCPIYTNTKYDTARNFTHYIKPGDHLVKVDDTSSVAAVNAEDKAATIVHVNSSSRPRTVTLDLSGFGQVMPGATVTPIRTSAEGKLVEGDAVAVEGTSASLQVPAASVTTFLVDGVHGVANDAALVQPEHVYRLVGVQSGKSLTATGSGAVIETTDPADAAQLWAITKLTDGVSNRERYAVTDAATGRQLAVRDGAVVLEPAAETPDDAAQWIMSTTGDGTWTFVNAATGRLAEVGGQSTADGAQVSTWLANSGSNQRWTVVDETILGLAQVDLVTTPGLAPAFPATVTTELRDGTGTLPVTWNDVPDVRWDKTGTVRVVGTAVDALGVEHTAHAVIVVDTIERTAPARAKTYVGEAPVLPETVTGVTTTGAETDLPARWDTPAAGAFDAAGVVTLTGTAPLPDGTTLPAEVRVQVTEPVEENAALAEGTEISATFTEPGYGTAGLRNGDTTDKAWSNWMPGTKNTEDTLTVELAAERDLTGVVTHFYRDGGHHSYAEAVSVQVRTGGEWVDAGTVAVPEATSGAPAVHVPFPAVRGDAVRVVLDARTATHMTVAEIEVLAHAPGVSSDAAVAEIRVGGEPVADLDPERLEYTVAADGEVTATAADPYAEVAVTQPTRSDPTATVIVTSEDGTQDRTYTVHLAG